MALNKKITYCLQLFFLLSLFANYFGCAAKKYRPRPLPQEKAESWLKKWNKKNPPLKTIYRASGQVRLEQKKKVVYLDLAAIFDGRDRIYLEISGFAVPSLILATSRQKVELYKIKENKLYQKSSAKTKAVNFELLGLAFTPESLQRALLAQPLLGKKRYLYQKTDKKRGLYILRSTASGGDKILAAVIPALNSLSFEQWQKRDQEKVTLSAKYSRFTPLAGQYLPRRLELASPVEGTKLTISWKKLELAKELREDSFKLDLPPTVSRGELE